MSHECPRNGCDAIVADSVLMCGPDWVRVPPPLQRAVYRAWDRGRGRGSLAHLAAMEAAIRAVNGQPEPAPKPSPHQLWEQAGEDPEEYRRLMREHGYLLGPGDPGYDPDTRGTCRADGQGNAGAPVLADPVPPRVPRDLSTVLWRRGRLSVVLEPRAWLIGLYVASGALHACLLPCLAVRWQWRRPGDPKALQDAASRPAEWMPGAWHA